MHADTSTHIRYRLLLHITSVYVCFYLINNHHCYMLFIIEDEHSNNCAEIVRNALPSVLQYLNAFVPKGISNK